MNHTNTAAVVTSVQNTNRVCPVCGTYDHTFLYRPKHSPGDVVLCKRCGLVYVSPIDDWKSIISDGPNQGHELESILHSSDLRDIADCWELGLLPTKLNENEAIRINAARCLKAIEHYQPGRGRLMDYGCGWGFFLQAAKERGWDICGLEPLPGHAVYARAMTQANIVTDTLHDNTFPADYFDAITALQVFEHLPNPAAELRKLHRIMRPEGVLLIEVPNIDTWSVRLLGKRHRHFVEDHLNYFSASTLCLLLKNSDFDVLESCITPRQMTIHHLVKDWGARFMPHFISEVTARSIQRLGLGQQIISLNIGDILTIIGRKPLL
ncbi:MAG: methyltransferase domain-containing protein [Chloroflexi bacterium]|nr:methyltransferase domain-containing protein [Chloroflexota bacterium]